MSIQVMNAVWQHSKSDGRARLVMLAIADHQGELGAWPSLGTLAKMVNSSERSVQRDIEYLKNIGELEVHYQKAPTRNHYKSNLYFVKLEGVTEYDGGVTNAQGGVTNAQGGVTAGGVQSLIEPLRETLTNQEQNFLFEEFWNEYPKKADKRRAMRAFASALKRTKFEDILAGAIAYKSSVKDTDVQFIKNPATWLNADAWENDIAPSKDSEAAERARIRKERELEESRLFLEQQRKLAQQAKPAPKCEHGESIVRCKLCLS
jgi:hypothetical protein